MSPATAPLIARSTLVRQVSEELRQGHSVLLFGPAGVGKSAVAAAVVAPGVTVVDPFERVTAVAAGRIRRGMDRGEVFLAVARTRYRQQLGSVGRILWRMQMVSVPVLSPSRIRLVLQQRLEVAGVASDTPGAGWLSDAVVETWGLPGRAVLLVDAAVDRWRRTGTWPSPGFIVAVAKEAAWRTGQ